ncbi:LLM class flavin-dependent oxidoreductase [Nocardia suismassiliense]|uniref:LLM class flavin-dependent oxidoreductase n=1 Tax=Nocardia suismassiliense TaxID=2077092 RepID=UPI000D1E4626|nr:LLM class flavin-dependent oxidoreductase [Nocardia suismassiliense]
MTSDKKAVLFFFPEWGGMHLTAWRDPAAPQDPTMDFATIKTMVRKAEQAKFHGFFLADTLAIRHSLSSRALSRTAKAVRFEPLTLMAALSGYTEHIGLLMTASTTYNEPYHVARQFASLDHLSGGRAGWNVVTSGTPAESSNFGREAHMPHDQRYRRAGEFFEAVTGLWDSFDDDAFERDKASGRYFDPGKMHELNYRGEFLSVAGPLTVARPIQGRPVIAQAGSSDTGRAFAAGIADVIYTLQPSLEQGRTFYADVKTQVADRGRDPDHVKVLPALVTVIGRTEAEAQDMLALLDSLVDDHVGLEQLAAVLETDLSSYPLDGPVPDIQETAIGAKTRQRYFLSKAREQNMTVRELMRFAARIGAVAHTPESIADHIEEWLHADAADGFNITFADTGASLDNWLHFVVPELQRRGLFHEDYSGTTLRENLGIPRPRSRYVAEAARS